MNKLIKTSYGTYVLVAGLILSLSFIRYWNNESDKLTQYINPTIQTAQVSGVNSGLVNYYTFDDPIALAYDTVGSNSGTSFGGPVQGVGRIGTGAINFDGVDDYIRFPSDTSLKSISFWIKSTIGNGKCNSIINHGGGANRAGFGTNGTTYFFTVYDGINYKNISGAGQSGWNHIVGVWDGADRNSAVFYINNVRQLGNTACSDGISNSNTLGVNDSYVGAGFTGLVDDLRIYNKALNDTDVQDLYNYVDDGSGGATPTPTPTLTILPTTTPIQPTPTITPFSNGTYYVSKTGSDSNSCTDISPCSSFTKAVSLMSAGDTLYVHSGIYDDKFTMNIPSGTDWTHPTTISAYPNEQVIIRPQVDNLFSVLRLNAGMYIAFNGFIFDAINFVNTTPVIKVTGTAQYIKFSNCEVKNSKRSHGFLFTSVNIQSHVWITHCDVHDNGLEQLSTDNQAHGIYASSGGNIIEYSKIHNNNVWGIQIYSGDMSDNTVRYNEIYGPAGGGILLAGGTNNLIYNNIFHDLTRSGINPDYTNANTKIFNNTFYHNGAAIVVSDVGNNTVNTQIYNNLIYDSSLRSRQAVSITSGAKNTQFLNNIVSGSKYSDLTSFAFDLHDSGTNTIKNNNFVGSTTINGSVMSSFSPQFANINPFVNAVQGDLHPWGGSQAINNGAYIGEVIDDFSGTPRPQGPAYDIGAYEYIGQPIIGAQSNPTPTNTPLILQDGVWVLDNGILVKVATSTLTSTSSPIIHVSSFDKNLKVGIKSNDVKNLQIFLNTHNFAVSLTAGGSLNNETTYFGTKTQNALIRFQKANHITPAVGYFGPITRGVMNKLR